MFSLLHATVAPQWRQPNWHPMRVVESKVAESPIWMGAGEVLPQALHCTSIRSIGLFMSAPFVGVVGGTSIVQRLRADSL